MSGKLKKTKVSKNRKKSWRKHTDISEFEEFLDDKRFEERIGHSINDAANDDLFVIQTTTDDTVYQEKLDKFRKKIGESSAESKLRKIGNEYRFYQKLLPTSQVPAVKIEKKNSDKRLTLHNDENKLRKYWETKQNAIENAKKAREFKQKVKQDPKLRFNTSYDLWGTEEITSNNKTVKVPEHLRQKPSLLPAIEIPLPGQSYNPDEKDYEKLLQSEAEKELQRITEEKIWADKVDKYFLTKNEARINEQSLMLEMSQGLFDKDENEENGEFNNEIINFPKNLRKKKTKKIKRREKEEKLLKKRKEKEKVERIKQNDVFRIKTIVREIKDQENKIVERAKIKRAKHIESLYKPKRLSRYRFEDKETELNLPNEISGSLRALKTEGNLLKDRFKSFQRRNLIEPRVLQTKKRKLKRKKEVKRRHRENE